jgi:hypothetical protein
MLPLENAVDHLKRAASAADAMLGKEDSLPAATQVRINASLAQIDQLLIDPAGLAPRPFPECARRSSSAAGMTRAPMSSRPPR